MEIGHYTGILVSELADFAANDVLGSVTLEYRASDSRWQVWVQHKAGDTYLLSEQEGWATMFFRSLRDALVFLKGAGVSEVTLDLHDWSPTADL
jgi:hypothetical protein